jgi:hypothetical protein
LPFLLLAAFILGSECSSGMMKPMGRLEFAAKSGSVGSDFESGFLASSLRASKSFLI